MRRLLDEYSTPAQPRVAVGEMHIYQPAELARFYGAALDELHLPFNFGLLNVPWAAEAARDMVDAYEATLPAGAWPNHVLGNHDESRIATRIGPTRARAAMLLLLTLRGTPTLYYGDELGLEDVPIPPERVQDPWERQLPGLGLGRDAERAPMPWDASPNAGFCPPTTAPWLPLGADYRECNVAAQRADPRSMLTLTRRLLALRRAHPALASGSYAALPGVPDGCYAYWREQTDARLLVLVNFNAAPCQVALPTAGRLLLSTHLDRDGPVEGWLTLRGDEGAVVAG